THAALDAARKAYAPYSKSPSGVAIRSASGRTYRGSYIENVAFNPSLSPLQVALTGLDRKSTRLNSSHDQTSYAVFCLKKKTERRRLAAAGRADEHHQGPVLHPQIQVGHGDRAVVEHLRHPVEHDLGHNVTPCRSRSAR